MAASPEAFEAPSLQRAWDQFLKNLGPLLVVTLVAFLFGSLAYISYNLFNVGVVAIAGEDNSSWSGVLAWILGEAGRLPFTILASFFGVLLAAVPAVYFATGEPLTIGGAFALLFARPWRYFFAGLLFSIVCGLGFVACVLPGLAVAFTYPIYVNRIFNTDQPILDAFSGSFQALYGNEKKWSFLGVQVLFWLVIGVLSVCTCGGAAIVGIPLSAFYIQNYAYRVGMVS